VNARAVAIAMIVAACHPAPATEAPKGDATGLVRRAFDPTLDGRWIGAGVCYGPHRDGQRPGGPAPTTDQLREDLRLMAPHWNLVRVYGSADPTDRLVALIHDEHLPFKLLLGVVIAPETAPDARTHNEVEVAAAIHLANAYPDVVAAIVVGNETQVSWTANRVAPDVLIRAIREVRSQTKVPIATGDDFAFWMSPESEPIVAEIDLALVHAYAMWNGKQLDEAMAFTRDTFAAVQKRHPDLPMVFGETGWATQVGTEGDQAKYIKGAPGEAEQARFFGEFTAWVTQAHIASTYFEAFDENWKGSPAPDEVEKHWGVFRADRTPKAAVAPVK